MKQSKERLADWLVLSWSTEYNYKDFFFMKMAVRIQRCDGRSRNGKAAGKGPILEKARKS